MAKPILMPHSLKDGKKASGCWWAGLPPLALLGSSFTLNPISSRVHRATATGHTHGLGTGRGVVRLRRGKGSVEVKERVPLELEEPRASGGHLIVAGGNLPKHATERKLGPDGHRLDSGHII